jgi:hypothetical protein
VEITIRIRARVSAIQDSAGGVIDHGRQMTLGTLFRTSGNEELSIIIKPLYVASATP